MFEIISKIISKLGTGNFGLGHGSTTRTNVPYQMQSQMTTQPPAPGTSIFARILSLIIEGVHCLSVALQPDGQHLRRWTSAFAMYRAYILGVNFKSVNGY